MGYGGSGPEEHHKSPLRGGRCISGRASELYAFNCRCRCQITLFSFHIICIMRSLSLCKLCAFYNTDEFIMSARNALRPARCFMRTVTSSFHGPSASLNPDGFMRYCRRKIENFFFFFLFFVIYLLSLFYQL